MEEVLFLFECFCRCSGDHLLLANASAVFLATKKCPPVFINAPLLWQKSAKRATLFDFSIAFLVPLGAVPELPAESCSEIRASEREDAASGNYWFDSIKPGDVALARCNMLTQGNYCFSEFQLDVVLNQYLLRTINRFRFQAVSTISGSVFY